MKELYGLRQGGYAALIFSKITQKERDDFGNVPDYCLHPGMF